MDIHSIWELIGGLVLALFAFWLTRQGQIRDKQDAATDKRADDATAAANKRMDEAIAKLSNQNDRLILLEVAMRYLPTSSDLDKLRNANTTDMNNLRDTIGSLSRDLSKEVGKLLGDQGVQLKMLMRIQDKLGTSEPS